MGTCYHGQASTVSLIGERVALKRGALILIAAAFLAVPLVAEGQPQTGKVSHIGVLLALYPSHFLGRLAGTNGPRGRRPGRELTPAGLDGPGGHQPGVGLRARSPDPALWRARPPRRRHRQGVRDGLGCGPHRLPHRVLPGPRSRPPRCLLPVPARPTPRLPGAPRQRRSSKNTRRGTAPRRPISRIA
jgi:hypothetical protein